MEPGENANCSIVLKTDLIASLAPASLPHRSLSCDSVPTSFAMTARRRHSSALPTRIKSVGISSGFISKSYAPCLTASVAPIRSELLAQMSTGRRGSISFTCSRSRSTPGMSKLVTTTSKLLMRILLSPSSVDRATSTR